MSSSRALLPVALMLAALAAIGCGGSGESGGDPVEAVAPSIRDQVDAAREVDPARFPKPPSGQSLEQFAGRFDTEGPQAVAATSVYRPPQNRVAFGLLDTEQDFTYGKTVLYLQRRGSTDPIQGPIAAPADVLVTEPRYRSAQAASEKDPFAAVYAAQVRTPRPGIYNLLAVSDLGEGRRIAAPFAVQVVSKAKDRVPDVGERPPAVRTDTIGSVDGDEELLTTRRPPTRELAPASFDDVLGKKPVALLFATPQLCSSRVCGPVTDEMLQLKSEYGDRMTFIHQEVYVDNDPNKGVREPLQRFNLPSEPWLFTVGRDGRVAARVEGTIGLQAFEDAVEAALR